MSLVFATVAAASTALGANSILGPDMAGHQLRINNYLPYPPDKVSTPFRINTDRLWYLRTPVGNRTPALESVYPGLGPAWYGAPFEAWDEQIYLSVNSTTIQISPWIPFHERGLRRYEEARQRYLREWGWAGGVRTHVNPARFKADAEDEDAKAGLGDPKAVIHIKERMPAPAGPLRVSVPSHFDARPARSSSLITVITPDNEASTRRASAE